LLLLPIQISFSLTDCRSGSIFPFLMTYSRHLVSVLPGFSIKTDPGTSLPTLDHRGQPTRLLRTPLRQEGQEESPAIDVRRK
jgi:hypothetical protein